MQKILLLILFFFCTICTNGQTLLVDKTNQKFAFNEKNVTANDKNCRIINYLSKEYLKFENKSIKPLIVIKIFGSEKEAELANKPLNSIAFEDYLNSTVLPKLKADMLFTFNGSNINKFDSLSIYDGVSYHWLPGIIVVESFNLYDFTQKSTGQTGQSILNTKAIIATIHSWTKDSLPLPDVDGMIGLKMFLLRKAGDEYTFFRYPSDCADCPLTFYNEYVYKKNFGVIAFRSKYLFHNADPKRSRNVFESNEYFYFR